MKFLSTSGQAMPPALEMARSKVWGARRTTGTFFIARARLAGDRSQEEPSRSRLAETGERPAPLRSRFAVEAEPEKIGRAPCRERAAKAAVIARAIDLVSW